MLLNTILAFAAEDNLGDMENFSGLYFLWLIGGLGAGCGIATFPMIVNVMFWTKQKEIGFSQAVFGGLGNCTAGIFALLMPIVMGISIGLEGLPLAYTLWLIITVIGTAVVVVKIVNPPYH